MLGVDDERMDEVAAWEEVPREMREAIIICCIAEKNTGKPIDAETAALMALHHRVPVNPVLLALGWMPPSHYRLDEIERTVLRLVAAMDLAYRAAH